VSEFIETIIVGGGQAGLTVRPPANIPSETVENAGIEIHITVADLATHPYSTTHEIDILDAHRAHSSPARHPVPYNVSKTARSNLVRVPVNSRLTCSLVSTLGTLGSSCRGRIIRGGVHAISPPRFRKSKKMRRAYKRDRSVRAERPSFARSAMNS